MTEFLMAAVRCDCGGRLEWGTEQTERGPRWFFACEWCGTRWRHNDGVFGPIDRDPISNGALAPAERQLLACFRRLSSESRATVVAHVQAMALSAGDAS